MVSNDDDNEEQCAMCNGIALESEQSKFDFENTKMLVVGWLVACCLLLLVAPYCILHYALCICLLLAT